MLFSPNWRVEIGRDESSDYSHYESLDESPEVPDMNRFTVKIDAYSLRFDHQIGKYSRLTKER